MEETRNNLQKQVDETTARWKAETDAIEDIKEATKQDLAESETLKEKARMLHLELERCLKLKDKKGETIEDLESHITNQNSIVYNLQREKETSLLSAVNKEDFSTRNCIVNEVGNDEDTSNDEVLLAENEIVEDSILKYVNNTLFEVEVNNLELTESTPTDERDIEDLKRELADMEALKDKTTQIKKQLEEVKRSYDRFFEQTATEAENNQSAHSPNIVQIVRDAMKKDVADLHGIPDSTKLEYAGKESKASIIRQHHSDIIAEFGKQIQAVSRKKPDTEKDRNPNKRDEQSFNPEHEEEI